jgi:hypothetical protein
MRITILPIKVRFRIPPAPEKPTMSALIRSVNNIKASSEKASKCKTLNPKP